MTIFSNTSFVNKNFTKISSAKPNISGVPDWKQNKGTLPGATPIVPPLGVTAKLTYSAKSALNSFGNVLKITS